jgi:hypothetical protein
LSKPAREIRQQQQQQQQQASHRTNVSSAATRAIEACVIGVCAGDGDVADVLAFLLRDDAGRLDVVLAGVGVDTALGVGTCAVAVVDVLQLIGTLSTVVAEVDVVAVDAIAVVVTAVASAGNMAASPAASNACAAWWNITRLTRVSARWYATSTHTRSRQQHDRW